MKKKCLKKFNVFMVVIFSKDKSYLFNIVVEIKIISFLFNLHYIFSKVSIIQYYHSHYHSFNTIVIIAFTKISLIEDVKYNYLLTPLILNLHLVSLLLLCSPILLYYYSHYASYSCSFSLKDFIILANFKIIIF